MRMPHTALRIYTTRLRCEAILLQLQLGPPQRYATRTLDEIAADT